MNYFELNIGAHVHCWDGDCGKLTKIALEPDTQIVTHLIVEEGLLLRRARVFPISTVDRALTDDIYLNLSSDQLDNYPEYREETVEVPDADRSDALLVEAGPYMAVPPSPMLRQKVRQGVPDVVAVLDRNTTVENLDGPGGRLESLLVEADSGHVAEVIMHHGLIFAEQKYIPIERVRQMSERAISVSANPTPWSGESVS